MWKYATSRLSKYSMQQFYVVDVLKIKVSLLSLFHRCSNSSASFLSAYFERISWINDLMTHLQGRTGHLENRENSQWPGSQSGLLPCIYLFFIIYYSYFILLLLFLFFCLPNVLKWLFPNSPFNNKTLINHALTGNAIRLRASAKRTRYSRMEWKRPGGAERLNCPVQGFKCRSVTSVNRLVLSLFT